LRTEMQEAHRREIGVPTAAELRLSLGRTQIQTIFKVIA
jgi:hypothetical protein